MVELVLDQAPLWSGPAGLGEARDWLAEYLMIAALIERYIKKSRIFLQREK